MAEIVIYTTLFCPFCVRAKGLLDAKGLAYEEKDVTGDPDGREAMRKRSNGRNTVPQIFIGETHVGGCDDLFDLERSGDLDRLTAS